VGGFPCQAFSVAGKRAGFNDTRGTLFFDIARILAEKRPRHLVLENVKGLLSHDQGRTFETIIGVLTDLGYFVEWQVLNSKDFGVPQNRERVFIVGHLGEQPRRKVFPIIGENETNLGQNLTLIEDSARHKPRVYDKVSPTVQSSFGMGGGHVPLATRQPLRFLNRNQKNIEGDYAYTVDASQTSGVRITNPKLNNYKGSTEHSVAITATAYKEPPLVHEQRIRRLTPLECERLQGFPDNWTVGSDTQRYKQCGNAVTVNVVAAVMSKFNNTYKED
jgi:DNA-cytosine methyltransferase